ncbi:MAG: DUF2971 domain-containing protein [Rhodobacteraceae bacterium]|nr:DUF2971 domain-containing protein [Paracoccaceae bacterium]
MQNAVSKQELWLNPTNAQNDPFDAYPSISISPDAEVEQFIQKLRDKYGRYISIFGTDLRTVAQNTQGFDDWDENVKKLVFSDQAMVRAAKTQIKKNFSKLREKTKIACFSEEMDSLLQWSHYANSHKGICYEYEVRPFHDNRFSIVKLHKVDYCNKRPSINTLEAAKFICAQNLNDSSIFSTDETKDILKRTTCIKSTEWKYEKEWRWIESYEGDPDFHPADALKLASLTFGANATSDTMDICKKIVGNDIPLYKINLSKSTYSLSRERI